jgi:hypothetical protein
MRWAGRLLASILIALLAAGCSSWEVVKGGPTAAPPTTQALPAKVRVKMLDGSTLAMEHPTVDGDSLRGIVVIDGPLVHTRRNLVVALKDVHSIESRRFDMKSTLGLVAGIGLVALGFMALLGANAD